MRIEGEDYRIQLAAKFYGPVAQWIRHRPTEPGIAGSSPAGFIWSVENRMQKYRFFAMSVLVGDCGVAYGGDVLMIVSERVVSVKCWWR